jgi:hypothetical protein
LVTLVPQLENSLFGVPADAHQKTLKLNRYWRGIAPAEGMLPGRRHFDPMAVGSDLLGHLWLVDVLRPLRFRFRLVGANAWNAYKRDLTGRFFDEAVPAMVPHSDWYRSYEVLLEARQPIWRRGAIRLPADAEFDQVETCLFPLAADGREVDMVLTITIFHDLLGNEY